MKLMITALLLVGVIGAGWLLLPAREGAHGIQAATIQVFVAAGVRRPVEEAAAAFTAATGTRVLLEYGGSGDLEARLMVSRMGDLYVPADNSYTKRLSEKKVVREVLDLAQQTPVLAVKKGNPLRLATLADARRQGVRLGVPNPESASLGKLLKNQLGQDWAGFSAAITVTKPTVTEIATDLSTGGLDAAVLWDSTVAAFPGIEGLPLAEFAGRSETVTAGVLGWSSQSTIAIQLARFLAAPETGNPIFAKHGFRPLAGDRWALRPQVVLFSGAVNRKAVTGILTDFSAREGVDIATTFNGCGILCASMDALVKGGAGQFPDGYYACDICFVAPVAKQFPEAVMLTSTPIRIAVPKGNPLGITGLADLARPGLRIGVCNAEQSTLGYITSKMLATSGLATAVMANAASQVPTGDLLINQLLTGSLDAAVVYEANIKPRADKLDRVEIKNVPAVAIQPYSVWKDSPNRRLMLRLLDHMRADTKPFLDAGFEWRGDAEFTPSNLLPVPDYLKKAPREF